MIVVPHGSLSRVIITTTMLCSYGPGTHPETGSPPPAYVLALLLERTTVFSADYPAARKVITHPFKRLMWLCLFVSALRSATDDEGGWGWGCVSEYFVCRCVFRFGMADSPID